MSAPINHLAGGSAADPICGLSARMQKKVHATSRRYLAQGVRRAMSSEYEGALEDLQRALRYDKNNIEARNLIGLIYYHRGEVGESVRAWTLSLYCRKENNRASAYLQDLQKNLRQYESLSESLVLYNEALRQAQKGDMEFAIVRLRKAVSLNKSFVRAYLLLALCYIQTNNLKKAMSALDKAERIEPLRLELDRYREFIHVKQDDGETDVGQEIKDLSRNFYVQQNMYQPDMEEISGGQSKPVVSMKNWSTPIMQLLLFFLGALCCFGFMMTLYVPTRTSQYRQEIKDQKTELEAAAAELEEAGISQDSLTDQIKEYQQQIAAQQKELEELREEAAKEEDTTQEELLWQAANAYYSGNYTDSAQLLYSVNQEELSETAIAFYNQLFKLIQSKAVSTLSNAAYAQYAAAYALEGEAQTEGLENALLEVEKALYFAQGTNWEAWQLYYKASIYQILGRTDEALDTINQFFTVYSGGTGEDLYGWATNLRSALQSRAAR